jgi:hypothetical protein
MSTQRFPSHCRKSRLRLEQLDARDVPSTIQDFEGVALGAVVPPGTVVNQRLNGPAPTVMAGGVDDSGKFIRLVDANPTPDNHNLLAFNRTDVGPAQLVIVDFDLRITAGSAVTQGRGRADGFGFAFLNTAVHGLTGAPAPGYPDVAEEPNYAGSIGVGFDIYQSMNLGDQSNNEVSVHFDGTVWSQIDAAPIGDLASGQWMHVRMVLRPGGGFSDFTLQMGPWGAKLKTLIDRLPIAGFTPYEGRVLFGARAAGETANYDVDNVNVQHVRFDQSLFSFGAIRYSVSETGTTAAVSVLRSGKTTQASSVRYTTSNGSALAGQDYAGKTAVLSFPAGVKEKTFTIPILNDANQEAEESFQVTLSNPSANAVITGRTATTIAIRDDETGRLTGQWGPIENGPLVGVHSVMLPTGQVLMFDRKGSQYLWNPSTRTFKPAPMPGYDLFCSGHSLLPDGRVLITGGHMGHGEGEHDGIGLPNVSTYNPFTGKWKRERNMNLNRWYPTNTTLPNGDVLVLSGSYTMAYVQNPLPQVWQTATSTWRNLTNAETEQLNLPAPKPQGVDLYPRMFVTPTGDVYKVGPDKDTWFLDTDGTGNWTRGPDRNHGLMIYGTAVMYAPGKILVMGGGDPLTDDPDDDTAVASAEVIDLNAAIPTWRTVNAMAFARRHLNATLLPDGRVLVTGGLDGPGFTNEAEGVLAAEVWNPITEQWTTLPSMKVTRGYHSTALLLPDGRVLVSGGGQGAGAPIAHYENEIFTPSYLFQGARPAISTAPTSVGYAKSFLVGSPSAVSVTRATMIRLGAVTHAFDQDQRFIDLGSVARVGSSVRLTSPALANLAPPGYYMLFLLNANGVPSVGKMIRLVATPSPIPPAFKASAVSSALVVPPPQVSVAQAATQAETRAIASGIEVRTPIKPNRLLLTSERSRQLSSALSQVGPRLQSVEFTWLSSEFYRQSSW